MMVPLSTAVSDQIRLMMRSLEGSNADSLVRELRQFSQCWDGGSIFLLKACLDHIGTYGDDLKNVQLDPAIISLFKLLVEMPNFCTLFCQCARDGSINERFLEDLSYAFCLSISEKLALGLALSESENPDIRVCGKSFCMSQIEKLLADPEAVDLTQKIQQVLMFLCQSEDLAKHVDTFIQMLHLVLENEHSPFIWASSTLDEYDEATLTRNVDLLCTSSEINFETVLAEIEKDKHMTDIMLDLGYGCTADVETCKYILSHLSPLDELTIARIISTAARTHVGILEDQNAVSVFLSATGYSCASNLPTVNCWNTKTLVDSIKELAPDTNWKKVVENLDHEGFYIPDEVAFTCLMSFYKYACQDPFPLHAICGSIWKNIEGQLSFLKNAVAAPPEVFSFSHSARQLANLDAVQGLKLQSEVSNHAWLCLDLLDLLCQLAEKGYRTAVHSMLEYPLKYCPDALLLGLAQINTPYGLVQYGILSSVFPQIISDADRKGVILQLWHINPVLVLRGFIDSLATCSDNIACIVDTCNDLKILNRVLEMIPVARAIRLAVAAFRKKLMDFEKWLNDCLITYRESFLEECLSYLKEVEFRTSQHDGIHHSSAVLDLYPEVVILLKVLQVNSPMLNSSHLSDDVHKLNSSFRLGNMALNDGTSENSPKTNYGDDIELEANSYFRSLFSEELSIVEMVQMLSRFKNSSNPREQAVFEYMINNLFEESKFFPEYPKRQLGIAALLFGSLIKNQFVTHLTLGIALRCVLDALRKPADSKMFAFGIKALEQFINRLGEWPQYCNHILQISHLRGTHSELIAQIEGFLNPKLCGRSVPAVDQLNQSTSVDENECAISLQIQPRDGSNTSSFTKSLPSSLPSVSPSSSEGVGSQKNVTPTMLSSLGFAQPSRGVTSTRFGSALNIETLVAAAERRATPIEAPSSEIQDKISFIVNNISCANIEVKAEEFSNILGEQYYPWFSQYMVMKRVSIEPKFHEVYLKFMDKVNAKTLHKETVQATLENCKVLLGSELIKSSSEERSLLKNLGSWLGKITIGKNQVLRARDLDPKSLVLEAYEKGQMIAVIPFTSKILESCQSSLAYQPPNPWTMGILALLAEIYAMPNLKMNLKFDIEVLFKNLGVNMKDVTPSSFLKDRARAIEGNPDFSNKDTGASYQPMIPEDKSGLTVLNRIELPLEVANASHLGGHLHSRHQYGGSSHTLAEDDNLASSGYPPQLSSAPTSQTLCNINQPLALASIQLQGVISPKIAQMGLHLHFQRVLSQAIDRAVKEILPGIIQRSVSIAIQTTKELVMKDYALETNESRIYNAAHMMVGSLAGSLAHVTCKEPLHASMLNHLKSMLQGVTIANESLEAAILIAAFDNLDLGCASIENLAHEKASEMIISEIAQQLTLRRKHWKSLGSSMQDASTLVQGHLHPDTIEPTAGQLSLSEQRVYEDFGHTWKTQQTVPTTNAAITKPFPSVGVILPHQGSASSGQLSADVCSSGQGNPGIRSAMPPLVLSSKEFESPLPQIFSASSNDLRVSEDAIQHRMETESVVLASSSMPKMVLAESSNSVKEFVVPSSPLPLSSASTAASEPLLTTRDALDNYQIVSSKLEGLLVNNYSETKIQSVVSEVSQIILRCVTRDEAALAVAQRVFKALYENSANTLLVSAHLAILAAMRDVCKLVVKELTSWVIYSEEERKFNKEITIGLIRGELLNLAEYNIYMAKLLDGGRNNAATEFAISLIQSLLIEEPKVLPELHSLVDMLVKLASRPGSPESLHQLVEITKNHNAKVGALSSILVGREDDARQPIDKKDVGQSIAVSAEQSYMDEMGKSNPNFNNQVTSLFAEWFQICELPATDKIACSNYILKLHRKGLLKGDDTSDLFFHILLELSVSHCLTSEGMSSSAQQSMSFLAVDIYAALVFSILKHCPVEQGSSRLFLLPKILAVTVRFIQNDADQKKTTFDQRPYFRLFLIWLSDVSSLDTHDVVSIQALIAFANAFHSLQPLKVPAFSFAWLELVSHRTFMPELLMGSSQKGWPHLHRLLMDLFLFMEPFLRNAQLGQAIYHLYRGTLRVLLVLLHDFPEFLCDYHFSFCDVIPPSCIQMRNIVLSPIPQNMRLPDPQTPNLKIDVLPEMRQSPRILSEVDAALKQKLMKADVDEYLKMRQKGHPFLNGLNQRLLLSPQDAKQTGMRYNVSLINSLVLYVGMQAIQQIHALSPLQLPIVSNSVLADAALDIFRALVMDLDTEGRYLFLNAIANQLRYPNNHTYYFSSLLLRLFLEAKQEVIQEQITRVFLDRLRANRPHPWGLFVTFIELVKNPEYNFWKKSFTRGSPEIENLFDSVARSCGGRKPLNEGMVGSGAFSEIAH